MKPKNSDRIRLILVSRNAEAKAKVSAANKAFEEVLNRFPGGPAHPDGVRRIKNALRTLAAAREERMTARKQLDEYIQRGIVPNDLKHVYESPDDLKRSG
jgi:hypothetical protein